METNKLVNEYAYRIFRLKSYGFTTLQDLVSQFGEEYSRPLLNQIEALKKENERARELVGRAESALSFIGRNSRVRIHGDIIPSLQSFLNEQKPEA